MEFLRFGSSIPGAYWGCCCGDIVQNFKVSPDAKASIQIVEGDGATPMTNSKGEQVFAGPTYRDIFKARLRIGTFSTDDMPNHFFLATLSKSQLDTADGKAWLAILKEEGFEFIRTVNNSVWNIDNYVFGLFRNISDEFSDDDDYYDDEDDRSAAVYNPFDPPAAWKALPDVMPEAYLDMANGKAVADAQAAYHKKRWDAIGPAKLLTEAELVAAKAPVIMAGIRSDFPQQLKSEREAAQKTQQPKKAAVAQPWGATITF